jgi:membrane protein required for beta-lactamase induction
MNFIVILICLFLQRFLNLYIQVSNAWFNIYFSWLAPLLKKCNKWLALVIVILPFLIILGLLQFFLIHRSFGMFYLVLSCAILFFCIDFRDLRRQKPGYDTNDAVLSQSFKNFFPGLFWFAILGPYGIIIYFILSLLHKIPVHKNDPSAETLTKLAAQIQSIADWVPAKLLGFTFALGGRIKNGFSYCLKNWQLSHKKNQQFIIEAGDAALGTPAKTSANALQLAFSLIDRSIIIWIIVIGLTSFLLLL